MMASGLSILLSPGSGWRLLAATSYLGGGPDELFNYLALAGLLFALGICSMISRRNAVGILMGVELILNASGINFAAFSRFNGQAAGMEGQVFTLFIIVLAAAEAAVALALVLAVFQTHRTIELDRVDELRL